MNAKNTNLILLCNKQGVIIRLKIEIARRWIANKIYFFQKVKYCIHVFDETPIISGLGVL